MRSFARFTAALTVTALVVPVALSFPAHARSSSQERTMKMMDTDNDGTIDLREAQAAGEATFDKLETDKDGSLTAKELGGRVSKKDLKAADGDSDGSLDKKEYSALIEQRFKAADPDGDGKLDAKELKKPAGRALMQLLK
ncbi:EF-hand domain-containing protein [Methylobacterium sp. J-059]|uniref:EF-hand domain-containing protein n=1 Tax=Methylobacterium sp. J-059 TaxID=2836643 RepID=UPI001FB9F887|nr:EF-hand domain-containing protein [Methylobacterium sp. J-059]MCJ2038258.1 EF-hand domain-containing protein [Methylobacterium sp. J-059]